MRESLNRYTDLIEPLLTLEPRQQFNALLRNAAAKGLPMAVWRLPGKKHPNLLIDLSGNAARVHPDLDVLPGGFLFAPYATDLGAPDAEENPESYFLQADLLWDGAKEQLQFSEGLTAEGEQKAEALLEACVSPAVTLSTYPTAEAGKHNVTQEHFVKLVQDSVAAIKRGDFQKVVCARTKEIALPAGFLLERFFEGLSTAYPNAFISLVAIPGIGTWVGASPEVLISVDQHKQFCTVALAGTQPMQPGMSTADAVWRQKEIEEQAMVSRYIINCFKKVRVREFEEVGPRTIAAANLLHLRTDFTVDLEEIAYPNLPTHMLQLLHPTSAVCGLPKAPAADFLKEHEALDRSFFAGFLGPVNLQQETRLFVNLRCMQLFAGSALLYAGAGITADSVPEREWQETEHKCQTLLDIIDKV